MATGGYRVRSVENHVEWEACFNAVCQPHLMQSWSYGQAKNVAANWHVKRYVFEKGTTPVAICQVLEKRIAGLRIASRINRGPLFLEPYPSYESKENIYNLLRQKWRLLSGPLLIAPALPLSDENHTILRTAGFRKRKVSAWCSALINLAADEGTLRAKLSSTWRNRLKHSQRSGLELQSSNSKETIRWMLNMHALNMQSKSFDGPSTALVFALYEAKPADVVVLSAMLDNRPVAAMLIVRFGVTAEYYLGWFSLPEGRKANSGNFLYWHAALEMQKAGHHWLDVGGYYSNDKFGHFKQGMGGTEYKLMGEWYCL